jgi:hypothetical protein
MKTSIIGAIPVGYANSVLQWTKVEIIMHKKQPKQLNPQKHNDILWDLHNDYLPILRRDQLVFETGPTVIFRITL